MTEPTLLILGQSTSGKTTLGRALVAGGLYKASIEVDDVDNWLGKSTMLRQMAAKDVAIRWSLPAWQELTLAASRAVGKMVLCLPQPVCVSGVWPGEKIRLISQALQDYRVVVIDPHSYQDAQSLWVSRGGKLKDDFSKLFDPETWDKNTWALRAQAIKSYEDGKYLEKGHRVYQFEWPEHPIIRPWDHYLDACSEAV